MTNTQHYAGILLSTGSGATPVILRFMFQIGSLRWWRWLQFSLGNISVMRPTSQWWGGALSFFSSNYIPIWIWSANLDCHLCVCLNDLNIPYTISSRNVYSRSRCVANLTVDIPIDRLNWDDVSSQMCLLWESGQE